MTPKTRLAAGVRAGHDANASEIPAAPEAECAVAAGPSARSGEDRCPGALRPFAAEDGLIIRARVPGGGVSLGTLRTLLQIGADYGTPRIQLTTRGNLQVRGLPDPLPDDVAERLADAGLLPSLTHERARNILAAPTSAVLRERARELDRMLIARPALARLPGRFLMLLTDSSGLGLNERFDVAYVDAGDGSGVLLLGRQDPFERQLESLDLARGRQETAQRPAMGSQVSDRERGNNRASAEESRRGSPRPLRLGRVVASDDALEAMLDVAAQFLTERDDERVWNIRDLPDSSPLYEGFAWGEVPGDPADNGTGDATTEPAGNPTGGAAGAIGASLGSGVYGADLVAGVPLGLLEAEHLTALEAVTDHVVITAWRSVLVPGGAAYADQLAAAGLIVDEASAWGRISACTGAPYCGRAQSETLSLARECVETIGAELPRLHLVGCGRRCGEPRGEHLTVVGAQSLADVRAAIAATTVASD
ncbi:MAG: hypothetical protein ACK5MR_11535 [Cumulibacter sp.]